MKKANFYLLVVFTTILTISSCSKKPVELEESETSNQKVYSGKFVNYCDLGPIYFNIDSLISNCPFPYGLDEQIFSESTELNSFTLIKDKLTIKCEPKPINIDGGNWDFSITKGNGYDLEWFKEPLSQQLTIINDEKFPTFLNGYKIQITENKALTLLFFNFYTGGCIYDSMTWEYVETE